MAGRRTLGLVAVAAAAATPRIATRRWATNPDPTGGDPLDVPDGDDMTVTTGDGATIAVRICGDRSFPVVVLVHGWTGDRRIWGTVAKRLLAAGTCVVMFDQRGHGHSTTGSAGWTVTALGDDVDAILTKLDLHHVVLAGHSMGGMAVQSFALRHRDTLAARVSTLVLVSTAASGVATRRIYSKVLGAVVGSARVDAAMARPTLGPLLLRGSFGRKPVMSHLVATRESFAATGLDTRRAFLEDMAAMDLRPGLSSVATPTIIVSGTRDTLLPHRLSKALAWLIPGAHLVAIRRAGHQLPFETPDRLAEILRDASRAAPVAGADTTPVHAS